MKARVKIPHFTHKFKALLDNILWKPFTTNIFGCESISDHNIALVFFDNKIWSNQWKNIIKHLPRSLPVKHWTRKCLFSGPSISRIFRTTKSIFKPYYEFFIATSYLKHAMPLKTVAIFALLDMANIQATFSVNKSCEISYLPYLMTGDEFNYFTHEYPFVYYIIVVNEKEGHRERLSERALFKGCDSLTSEGNSERMGRRAYPAYN